MTLIEPIHADFNKTGPTGSAPSAFLTKGRANLIRGHKTKGYKKQNEENLSDFPRFWCA